MVMEMSKNNAELMNSLSNATDWTEWSVMEAATLFDDMTVITNSNGDHQNNSYYC